LCHGLRFFGSEQHGTGSDKWVAAPGQVAAAQAGSFDWKGHSFFPSHFGPLDFRSILEDRFRTFHLS
jgi:hypothetical protein